MVTNTFAVNNPTCPQLMRQGFAQLLALANSGDAGLLTLTSVFKLCSPLKASRVEHLVLWAVNAFVTVAMCDYPYPTNFLAPLPAYPASYACQQAALAKTPLEALAVAASLPYNGTSGTLKVCVFV